jgi:intracellular septation protein
MLIGGWVRGQSLARYVLEAAYDGLSEKGWLKLSLNWGICFSLLGNRTRRCARRSALICGSRKVWGVTIVTFLVRDGEYPDALAAWFEAGR